jgi:anti-sigma regulatory factor (Ser/Thr protein kinase)
MNELATNTIEHGGGGGIARIWADDDALVFQVEDSGRFADALAGRFQPSVSRIDGRGLWIANQLCDLVQIRRRPTGTVVRARVRRIGFA